MVIGGFGNLPNMFRDCLDNDCVDYNIHLGVFDIRWQIVLIIEESGYGTA